MALASLAVALGRGGVTEARAAHLRRVMGPACRGPKIAGRGAEGTCGARARACAAPQQEHMWPITVTKQHVKTPTGF